MSGKYPKTSTQDVTQLSEFEPKIPGKSDGYNLSQLYPKSPQYNGYADNDVIELAKLLLKSRNVQIIDNPDFPQGIILNYNHTTLPDQNEVKQTSSPDSPLVGEGHAPLPHIDDGVIKNDVAPFKPDATDISALPNVKTSTQQSVIAIDDVLIPGKQKK